MSPWPLIQGLAPPHGSQKGQLSDRIQRLKCSIFVEFFSQINKINAGLYSVTAEILAVISQ